MLGRMKKTQANFDGIQATIGVIRQYITTNKLADDNNIDAARLQFIIDAIDTSSQNNKADNSYLENTATFLDALYELLQEYHAYQAIDKSKRKSSDFDALRVKYTALVSANTFRWQVSNQDSNAKETVEISVFNENFRNQNQLVKLHQAYLLIEDLGNNPNRKYLSPDQDKRLTALVLDLNTKLNECYVEKNKVKKDKLYQNICECAIESNRIINSYAACRNDISNLEVHYNLLSAKDRKEALHDFAKKVEARQNEFAHDVKYYEQRCAKWNLGQKLVIGGLTLIGGLVGAVVGFALGAIGGAIVVGGLCSVVPVLGNIAGAIAGGSAAGVYGAITGMGIGVTVATAAAIAILGAGAGVAAKAGVSSLAMNKQQFFVTSMRKELSQEVNEDVKLQKQLAQWQKERADLQVAKDELKMRPSYKKYRKHKKMAEAEFIADEYNAMPTDKFALFKNSRLANKTKQITALDTKIKELESKIENRKAPSSRIA